MTMVTRSLLILSLLFAGRAATACAQDEPTRSGFWFGLGLGYGAASFTCNGCSGGPRLGGWALSFALGVTPNPNVRVAAGGSGWLHGWKGDRLPAIDAWAFSLSYYPRLRGGPFVEGGVGPAHYMLAKGTGDPLGSRSEEHTSELQSLTNLVCRLLLEKKKKIKTTPKQQRKKKQHTLTRIQTH